MKTFNSSNTLFLLIIHLLIISSCATASKVTSDMTPRQEYYLGRSVSANILAQYPLVRSSFTSYLNKIGNLLVYNSARPNTYKGYHFVVIDAPRPMGVSVPGGTIFISKSLIEEIQTEDQLAAVLAHEISHIVAKHAQSSIKQSKLTTAGVTIGVALLSFFSGSQEIQRAVEHYDELIIDYSERIINGSYNKSQEVEADAMAVDLLQKAGYNPRALGSFLQTQKTDGGGWTSNHPSDEDRISKLSDKLEHFRKTTTFATRTSRFQYYQKRI